MPKTLQTQQVAPDFTLPNVWGGEINLWDYYDEKHVILFFLRGRNNLSAREHLQDLIKSYGEIQSLNAEILLILNEDLDSAQSYAEVNEIPFPVLADPNQTIYDLYYLGRAYLVPTRTACLAINRDGIVTYFKVSVNPWGWRHENRDLIEHIRGLNMRSNRS